MITGCVFTFSCQLLSRGEGALRFFFDGDMRLEVWNPFPFLSIFLPQKMTVFQNFCKSGPIFKGFSTFKNGWFFFFFFFLFAILVKCGPLVRIFVWLKWNPCLRILGEKWPFGWHSPVCLNMLVPPPHPLVTQLLACTAAQVRVDGDSNKITMMIINC